MSDALLVSTAYPPSFPFRVLSYLRFDDLRDQRVGDRLVEWKLQITFGPRVNGGLFLKLWVTHRRIKPNVIFECADVNHDAIKFESRHAITNDFFRFRCRFLDRRANLFQDCPNCRRMRSNVVVDGGLHVLRGLFRH
jgi:hypothetical protein